MKYTLKITKHINGTKGIFELDGAINVTTSMQLEKEIRAVIKSINDIVFDFKNVIILTSAGIRVLMASKKEIKNRGKLSIINCPSDIKKIFKITGLINDLHIS